VRYDFKGESRQFKGEGSGAEVTFFLSLLIIYLVLAAQFESWRDPFVILMSVPLSIAGAMAFLFLGLRQHQHLHPGGAHHPDRAGGQERHPDRGVRQPAASERGTEQARGGGAGRRHPAAAHPDDHVSMLVAMIPLLIASGPGAVSRFDIGLVIVTGLGIGTLFTLFVVPAFYRGGPGPGLKVFQRWD
jgi:multidrug efflux pump